MLDSEIFNYSLLIENPLWENDIRQLYRTEHMFGYFLSMSNDECQCSLIRLGEHKVR